MHPERLHLYTHTMPIRWRDVDPHQVVNHSIYFTYLEETRWHWFHTLPVQEDESIIPIIVEANINYKKSLTYPGIITIKLYSTPPTKNSWIAYHEIFTNDAPDVVCTAASIKLMFFDVHAKCLVSIPSLWAEYFYPGL